MKLLAILSAVLLAGCTYNVSVTKNVGPGCSSQFAGTRATDAQGGGSGSASGGEGQFLIQLATAMQTDDDCRAETTSD